MLSFRYRVSEAVNSFFRSKNTNDMRNANYYKEEMLSVISHF